MGIELKLKPCPFCGTAADFYQKIYDNGAITAYVACKKCHVRTREIPAVVKYCANDEAAKIWNQRKVAYECKADLHAKNESRVSHCDELICSNCRLNLQDWVKVRYHDDEDDMAYYQYAFQYCPNCGAKIDDENEEGQK